MPGRYETTKEWRMLTAAFRHAQCGTHPKHLPILPNIQNPRPQGTTGPNGPLKISEVEGELDVWFYEPHFGTNALLEAEHSEWPENRMLPLNPLLYAYTLLQPPFDMKSISDQVANQVATTDPATGGIGIGTGGIGTGGIGTGGIGTDGIGADGIGTGTNPTGTNPTGTNPTGNNTAGAHQFGGGAQSSAGTQPGGLNLAGLWPSESPIVSHLLWMMRLQSCPRPYADRQDDGESTPVNNSASKALTPHMLWNVQRVRAKEKITRHWNGKGESERSEFPSMAKLRDTTFVEQHVMDRSASLCETFKNANGEPTLAELLFGFFEYFGTRINYATDVTFTTITLSIP
ncbi:hypothetical protein GNI_092520 [Gregarina niphandrodes]|uniref:Uncharacterized protein n=1 Tax=Gregarina niphandrodes TaxID=110365 RepID=A0A023B5B9_GRENI|nr:hypothetical protein GNI_092520 [Gregarina niphandrodes]EZG59348.1 hypothetical protein GNI_092520 [Gregarina niphandrodes]|eukprot:XP_011130895.1 hypothetical protein GNI_092520 [Gregarina niphandrodes]